MLACMPRTNFTIRLSEDGLEAIAQLAKQEQRTMSDMARILLGEAVAARATERRPDHDWARLREHELRFGLRGDDE